MPIKISPSLAAAPLTHIISIIHELEQGGADYVHFDIEDGVFVPMMTLGTRLIADLRPISRLPFDVHLMTVNPEWLVREVIALGANRVSVHYEACPYPRRVLRTIQSLGAIPGIAFNPATPLPDLRFLLPYLRFVVILTTEPEGEDCPFLEAVLEKVRQGRAQSGLEDVEWVVDGGITPLNINQVARAGAHTVVVGRYLFSEGKVREHLAKLREAV